MVDDPEAIVRQAAKLDEQYRTLTAMVRGPEAARSTAAEVELSVFRAVLALGAELLRLWFMLRAAACPGPSGMTPESGWRLNSWRERTYLSVFGPIAVRRRYYVNAAGGGSCPLDEALSMPRRKYSDVLRGWLEYVLTNDAYDASLGLIDQILGVRVSKRDLERLAAEDATDVESFYAALPSPEPSSESTILVAQIDGKGVRMLLEDEDGGRRTEKREAVVTALYTVAAHQADPQAIADTLAGKAVDAAHAPPKHPRPEPRFKHLHATLDGKDVAFERLAAAVAKRDGPHIAHRVALTDGAQSLQQKVADHLPSFKLILDIVHVANYVQAAATAMFGEGHPHLKDFVARQLHDLLTGRVDPVIALFEAPIFLVHRGTAANRAVVATTAGYLRRNAPFMAYQTCLANGWPIATGVIEGACGHLVKDRMERAGMKWSKPGAQAVLDLRSVRVNDHWNDYQSFRRHRAHLRRYGSAQATVPPPEDQLLQAAA